MVNILRGLRLKRVAHVDRGAGDGVTIELAKRAEEIDDTEYMRLTKREFSAEQRRAASASGAAMAGGRYPIENEGDLENAIRAVGRGKGSHAAIRAHIKTRARALGLTDKLPEDWGDDGKAEKKLTITHGKDGTISICHEPEAGEPTEETRKRLDAILGALQFAKASPDGRSIVVDKQALDGASEEDVAKAAEQLAESVESIYGDGAISDVEKASLLRESFEQFTTHVSGVTQGLIQKALVAKPAEKGASMSALLNKALGLPEDATDADVEKFAAAVAKMSDAHAKFMNHPEATMPRGGKKAFADMEPGERDAHMKKNPVTAADDEEDEADQGADESTEKVLKNLPPEIRKMVEAGQLAQAQVEKLETANEVASIAKRLSDYPMSVADPAATALVLHKMAKTDKAGAEAIEKEFARLQTVLAKSALFEESGSGRAQVGKALDAINAGAQKIIAENAAVGKKVTIEKARVMFRDANPEIAKQERDETTARRKAA